MPNYRIGSEGPVGGRAPARFIPNNPDDARFRGPGIIDPNAGYIDPGARGSFGGGHQNQGHSPGRDGFYDPHGSDRFRFAPPARMSFREHRRPEYGGNIGSPGNWGWDQRTHLGNDRHHRNAPHNSYGWDNPQPSWGDIPDFPRTRGQHHNGHGNRGHRGHGHEANRMPDHHVDYHPNHYGGRSYPFGPSRNRHFR